MKKILIAFTCIFTLCTSLFAKNDTYIYDFWSEYEKSADAYRVVDVKYASDLGLDIDFKSASSLYCLENSVFVCDSGNNRIIELKYNDNKTLEVVRIIDHFNSNGQVDEQFNGPSDIFINTDLIALFKPYCITIYVSLQIFQGFLIVFITFGFKEY